MGLKALYPRPSGYDSATLLKLLKTHGPLWCAGRWYGPKHIVVLAGITDTSVFVNDPGAGRPRHDTVAWFNSKLDNSIPGCIMYKDPYAY